MEIQSRKATASLEPTIKTGVAEGQRKIAGSAVRLVRGEWELTCKLCADFATGDIAAVFRHAVEHGIDLMEWRESAMNPIFIDGGIQFRLKDGRTWLDATGGTKWA
jgi:hypothetical protein